MSMHLNFHKRAIGPLCMVIGMTVFGFLQTAAPQPRPSQTTPAIVVRTLSGSRIVVENSGNSSVEISGTLQLEQLSGTTWNRVSVTDLQAVSNCDQQSSGQCITLSPGEFVRPVPWTGYSCSSQCNHSCRANVWMPGTFRYVVTNCTGTTIVTSSPFVVSNTPDTPPFQQAPAPAPVGPGDSLPEPSGIIGECRTVHRTRCVHSPPSRTARLASPYDRCNPNIPRVSESILGHDHEALFSPVQTRENRRDIPDACCYQEFSTLFCR